MTELNILAVQNAALLTAIAETPDATKAQLATAAGKDRSNLNRSLAALIGGGLIQEFSDTHRSLTRAGEDQLHAIRRAEGRAGEAASTAEALPEGLLALRHDQILPDPDNARQDWTSDEAKDELDALRADIVQNGLLQNLVVRPMADDDLQDPTITVTTPAGDLTLPRYRLVAGERRWRAIGEAISDGDWEPETPILARFLDRDAKETRFAAIAENLLRRKLNPIEKAKGFEQLAELGFENKLIAERLGYTPEHVQQHRRFLKLDEADQQRMTLNRDDPRHLSVRDARQKLSSATAEAEKAAELEAVPADERLMAAEILHAISTRAGYSWADLVVGAGIAEDEVFARLKHRDWLRGGGLHQYGESIGHYVVSRSYGLPYDPFAWFFGKDEDAIAAGLKDAQREAGHPDAEGYLTPWLKPDPERSPEGQAMFEAAQAERAQAAEREAERQARIDANLQRFRDARARHAAILNAAHERADAGAPEENVAIAADIDRPLPWTLTGDGILAANGQTVRRIGDGYGMPGDRDLAIAQMIVVAVNAAGGLATPVPETEDAPDEEAFLIALGEAVSARQSELDEESRSALVASILADFLDQNGVAFGDEGFDWTPDGAVALVDAHYEEAADQDEAA